MTFVVNGSEWDFTNTETEEVHKSIAGFLDIIGSCLDREEAVLIGDDFQYRTMVGDDDIWTVFSPGGRHALSNEVFQELIGWLARPNFYTGIQPWPENADETLVAIDGEEPSDNYDVAWVHHTVRNGGAMACLSLTRDGVFETLTERGLAPVHFVRSEAAQRLFWRNEIMRQGASTGTFLRLAPHAFPDTFFVSGALSGGDRFDGGFGAQSVAVLHSLAVLDDHGRWIFTQAPPAITRTEEGQGAAGNPSSDLIKQRFRAYNVVAAPENPDVWRHGKSRRARECKVGEITLYCEWHIKLEPHRNRMHIHSPGEWSDQKVVVAILHPHLPLPGDP